jgi:DNA-binding LytR/AlgR family response regulator
MMITVYAIDDEKAALQQLQGHIGAIGHLQWLGSTTQPLQALSEISQLQPQLVFLDLQMPDLHGLELLRLITTTTHAKVIITTGNPAHALEGYDGDAVDYLLKPYDLPRLLKAIQKAQKLLLADNTQPFIHSLPAHTHDFIFVKPDAKTTQRKIMFEEIDYIEADKNYIRFHCGTQIILVTDTLKNLEQRLPVHLFIRIHKSFIIPAKKVAQIDGDTVIL